MVLHKFKTPLKQLEKRLEFAVLFAGPLHRNFKQNVFEADGGYKNDRFKIYVASGKPTMYVYGKGDSLKHDIKFGIIEEGDYRVIEFKGGHNIP